MNTLIISTSSGKLLIGATPIPVAPTSLAASTSSTTVIGLTWTDSNGSLTQSIVVESSANGTTGWSVIATLAAGTSSYSHTSLTPNTIYYYRVKVVSVDSISSSYSSTANATTLQSTPGAVANLVATQTGSSSIDLSWDSVGLAGALYSIERSSTGSGAWSEIVDSQSGITYSDSGLPGSTTYYYRVRATTNSGSGGYSNVASATTLSSAAMYLDSFSQPTIRKVIGTSTDLWVPEREGPVTVSSGTCRLQNNPYTTGTSTGGNTSTTLVDTNGIPNLNFGPSGWGFVHITGGTGAGQIRAVSGNPDANTLSVGTAWTVTPDATSTYATYAGYTGGLYFLPYNGGYVYPNGFLGGNLESGTFDPDVDRLSVRIKSSFNYVHPTPYNTMQFGTYCKAHADSNSGSQGNHYYHYCGGNWYANQWALMILNRKPSHRVSMTDIDWAVDPEYQQGYYGVGNRISNSTVSNGSTTVTPLYPSEVLIGSSYFDVGFKLIVRPRSQSYITPGAYPAGAHPIYTVASFAGDGSTFTLDRPFEGATGNWSWDNTQLFPSNMSNGTQAIPTHYYDGLTNFYIRFDVPKPPVYPAAIAAWQAPYYYYDEFEFSKSNGYEPDNILYNIWCIYTGTAYEVQWNGPKYTNETYTVYYGSVPLANSNGTYNGSGTSGGSVGPTSGVILWTSSAMAEQNTIYFFIKPASTSTGTHFKMTKKV